MFQILSFDEDKNMVDLIFYGDRTTAKMFKTTIITFDEGCKSFQPGKRTLLNKAVKEALFEQHLKQS